MILEFERLTHLNIETLLDQATNNQLKPVEIRSIINEATKDLTNAKQVIIDVALRSFLRYWDKPLPTTDIKYDDSNTFRRYTKSELLNLIGFLDKPLEKLYAIIAAESGLRASTILKLTYEHIREDLNNRTNSIAVRLQLPFHKGRKKSGYTFVGSRARELLNFCIKHRLIATEPESRLFSYSYSSIQKIIRTGKRKAEIPPDVHTIHGFRSAFKWALESPQPSIDSNRQKMMMGRFDDIDAKKYTDRDYETLRPDYERAYPFLDYTNNAPEQAQQVSDQQTELRDTIKQQNERILLQQYQLKEIQSQLGPINQALSALGDMYLPLLSRNLREKASDLPIRDVLKELIQQSIPVGKKLGQKPPPNFLEVVNKGADSISDQELQEIQQLVNNGDFAAAFAKMTKYIPIELSQYQP